jgi:hypothetical protein
MTESTPPQTAASGDGIVDDRAPERIGRRRFIQGAGAALGSGAITSMLPAGVVEAAVPVGASSYRPLATGVRVLDTRRPSEYTFAQIAANKLRLTIAGANDVPATASALALTVTGVNGSEPNFVTVYPTGWAVPTVSSLNLMRPAEINANLVTVKTGTGGQIDVFTRVPCHVIVDVLGYYEPVSEAVSEGRFIGLEQARRAADTRPNYAASGSTTVVDVSTWVPPDASSVVINLAATQCTGPGYFTAFSYADDTVPSTSSLNVIDVGTTRAAGVIVPVSDIGGKRRIKIFTLTAAKLIVDVNGYFTGPASSVSQVGLFVPLAPTRILDTREPGQIGRMWPKWVVEGIVPAPAAEGSAIVGNLTAVGTRNSGFLTISAARLPIPGTSNVNCVGTGAVVPNHVITPITETHGFQVYSSHGAHVLFDIAGYFTGVPKSPLLSKYQNPAPPPAPPPWIIRVPRFGLVSTVRDGNPNTVTNSGDTWHWTGTGNMGEIAQVALFGHRTDAGGPYRYLDWLEPGDLFTITSGDAREYTYRVLEAVPGPGVLSTQGALVLTGYRTTDILSAVRLHPGKTTVALIACTIGYDNKGNDRYIPSYPYSRWLPTSLGWRIVVGAELVSWRELT